MSIEILESGNLSGLTFGHAYETLYLAGDEFQYLSNILYLAATIEFDDQMKIKHKELTGPVYKYRAFGEYSVIDKFNPNKGIDCHVITPAGLEDIRDGMEALQCSLSTYKRTANGFQFPLASDFYCIFFRLVAPDFISPPLSVIQPRTVPAGQEFVKVEDDGNLLFNFHSAKLEWMYKSIRTGSKSSS